MSYVRVFDRFRAIVSPGSIPLASSTSSAKNEHTHLYNTPRPIVHPSAPTLPTEPMTEAKTEKKEHKLPDITPQPTVHSSAPTLTLPVELITEAKTEKKEQKLSDKIPQPTVHPSIPPLPDELEAKTEKKEPAPSSRPPAPLQIEKTKIDSPSKSLNDLEVLGFSVNYKIPYKELSFGKALGDGGHGTVYEGFWRKQRVAIKEYHLNGNANGHFNFNTENEMMRELQRFKLPCIATYAGSSTTIKQSRFSNSYYEYNYVVMEYIPGKDIGTWINDSMSPSFYQISSYQIIANAAAVLVTLHSHHIIHRDLKWENMMLTEGNQTKLIDSGDACILPPDQKYVIGTKIQGTTDYIAPEIFTQLRYSYMSDIYAFAVMMYILVNREDPYRDMPEKNIKAWVINGNREKIPSKCPLPLASLIKRCWDQNPDHRPTAVEVHKELREFANKPHIGLKY